MTKEHFDIVTLSDCNGCRKKRLGAFVPPDYQTGGSSVDPITIITGGFAIIQGILGLFGGSRRLTQADWQKLFPANGYWTSRLRNYLSNTIHWDTDLKNISQFTLNFVHENLGALSGGKYVNLQQGLPASEFNAVVNQFYKYLQDEAQGIQTPGGVGFAGMGDLFPIVLVGGLVWFLVSDSKKGRRRKA